MKMALSAIIAVITLGAFQAQAQLAGIHCVGMTFPPGQSKSYFRFTINTATNEPGIAGFRFHLYKGTGPLRSTEVPGQNVTQLDIAVGTAGEMRIAAELLNDTETTNLKITYEGNDFSTRIPVNAVTQAQQENALMNLFLMLGDTGGFGHISKDPAVNPSDLGGLIQGFTPWQNFQETIRFQNTICARYK